MRLAPNPRAAADAEPPPSHRPPPSVPAAGLLIGVEGTRTDQAAGTSINKPWHSSTIVERVDSHTVRTASGSTYQLVGRISTAPGNNSTVPVSVVSSGPTVGVSPWRLSVARLPYIISRCRPSAEASQSQYLLVPRYS